MKTATALPLPALLGVLFATLGGAAQAQVTATSASSGTTEPNVQRSVIEDDGSRIEELRVRGQSQRIVVTPKLGPKASYEIVTGDGSRDLSDSAAGHRGAIGKRVWHVLSF